MIITDKPYSNLLILPWKENGLENIFCLFANCSLELLSLLSESLFSFFVKSIAIILYLIVHNLYYYQSISIFSSKEDTPTLCQLHILTNLYFLSSVLSHKSSNRLFIRIHFPLKKWKSPTGFLFSSVVFSFAAMKRFTCHI